MTAFGPFGDTVEVDFDALSAASVFLLCGETGAGKTTVLDGVCFALYGDVPSARGSARQLRSHHATPGVAPRVRLELSLAARRFRFTRSPAWQRPKKRGSGLTTEQARVLVEEHVDGSWVLRSNRMDEAGQLVGELVGMTLTQFSQVVLLPQGQFDTFLRASSEERQKVLTRLFATDRFEQVERWFAERRKELWRGNKRHHATTVSVLHRLSESSGVALPAEWDDGDLTGPAADGAVRHWAEGLLADARARRQVRREELSAAEAARDRTEEQLATAGALAQLQRRRATAVDEQEALRATSAEAARDQDRLDAARLAATVVPLAELAEEACRARRLAGEQAGRAVAQLADALGVDAASVRNDDLAAREEQVTTRLAAARAFLPRAEELERARSEHATTSVRIEELSPHLDQLRERLRAVPVERDRIAAELVGLRELSAQTAAHAAARGRLTERLAAARARSSVAEELRVADAEADQQVAHVRVLREGWLELRERRLDGMAAELAAGMAVGQDCPVCGSVEHPSPALLADDAPSKADEAAARKACDDAEVVLVAHRDRVRTLAGRLASLSEVAGDATTEQLRAELAQARAEVEAARAAAAAVGIREGALRALDRETTELHQQLAAREADLGAARQRRDDLAETVSRLSAELAVLLDDREEHLGALIAGEQRLRERLSAARVAVAEEMRRDEAAEASAVRLDRAAQDAGFEVADDALRAHLTPTELEALARESAARRQREEQVAQVLADPAVAAAAGQPTPVLAALEAAHRDADRAHSAAAGALRVVEQGLARIDARAGELDEALAAWAPARAEYHRVRTLADLVEGKGADNVRQMRLSAYVLASRLSQVVAAANERLARLIDGRYVLEHSERAAGDRRGGLSLAVRDQWTDEQRDPVTLSGGETFVVSLALALGLADVVTAEAGGTRVDTLFVDEGFGSLDAETLEQVMDTLDQLREGGRVVGVVSHVSEMRSRIPTRLQVVKGRAGSTVEQQH
ncbi:MAG TPA: SMC family ATPase [Marmoricola sp.]|nr:SMC family ATPase [Marmoricola sp.]